MLSEAENRFGYETIAVHVDLSAPAAARIGVAADLATRLGSSLIGVAGELPLTGYADESALGAPRRLVADETRRVAGDLARAEALFKSSLGSAASKAGSAYEWRGYAQDPIQVLREQMLRCDLLVIGRQGVDDEADWRLGVAPQDVVLEIGRPLLLVPPAASFKGDCVVVAWKDTREARRALWDALPLLKRADMVLLAGVQDADEGESIDGAAAYLRRHAVRSVRTMRIPRRNSVLTHLLELGDSEGADLLIAGAYGHSRTREWVLGGVTREILLTSPMCCLLTH